MRRPVGEEWGLVGIVVLTRDDCHPMVIELPEGIQAVRAGSRTEITRSLQITMIKVSHNLNARVCKEKPDVCGIGMNGTQINRFV